MYTKKKPTTRPMQDYFAGKAGVLFPSNPYGYFTLMGRQHRIQELAAEKNDPSSKKPWWKR